MEPWFEAVKDSRSKLEKQVFRFGFLEFGQKSGKNTASIFLWI